MAIRVFIYSLMFLVVISFITSGDAQKREIKPEDKPGLIFDNSTVYTLTQEGLSRIIISQRAERYKTKDVMYQGKIITESKKDGYTDFISADLMVKRGDKFKFINNAKYNRENFIEVNSDEILYNAKTRIATNSMPFTGKYYEHTLNGSHLFFNANNSTIKAKKAHFEVQTTKEK